ncbi:hypothetical protein [Streptomyces sp. NPDC001750]|uniref:hypothetical protein n=1 Tax=Streptomyces sp. NPDC001750 TaxID=3364607 RepID=UPI0036C7C8C3
MLAALYGRVRELFAGPAPAPVPNEAALTALWLDGRADLADFDDCPREHRRTPHCGRLPSLLLLRARDTRTGLMIETHEPFGAEYVRPTQAPCPTCPCCSARLCETGRTSVMQCLGHVAVSVYADVAGCPCSAETTRGTHAWRAAQIQAVKHATESPMPIGAETILRVLAGGHAFEDPAGHLTWLHARRYATTDRESWRITMLGRRYLSALDEPRYTSAVYVKSVDLETRTATVVVIGWHMDIDVTTLADPISNSVGLPLDSLPGRYLDARVNLGAADPDDLVLTRIQLPAQITADYVSVRPIGVAR